MVRMFATVLVLVATVASAEARTRLQGQRSGLLTTGIGKSDPDKARFKSAKTFYSGLEIERR